MRLIYVAPFVKNPNELAVTVVKITSMKVPELLWEKMVADTLLRITAGMELQELVCTPATISLDSVL